MANKIPQWQDTVNKKLQLRDEAIKSFIDKHPAPENTASTSIDDVKGCIDAISSGAVTSSEMCIAYIQR
jgi:hypothetical protein